MVGVKELIQSKPYAAFSWLLTLLQSDVLGAVNDLGAKIYINASFFFLCGLADISHAVSGINNDHQFSIKNRAIMGLAGSRSVSQECLLNAGHVGGYHRRGKYLTHRRPILHMHGQKTYSPFQNRM